MENQCTGTISKKSWDQNNPSLKLPMRNWNMKSLEFYSLLFFALFTNNYSYIKVHYKKKTQTKLHK